MPQDFWIEEYRKKAALKDPVAQSGRGNQFDAVEFIYVAKQTLELLDVQPEHEVLDVGCANGLLDILLSACCRNVLAIEPVEELVELARKNLADCPNTRADVGHGAEVPAEDASFDRVLVWGMVQLIGPEEVKNMFAELNRVTRPGGRILIGSIPDGHKRDAFLIPYIEDVRKAEHLSEEKKQEIIDRNQNAHWYTPEELTEWWEALGGSAQQHSLPASDPNSKDRYHLVLKCAE
jgi:cyclopropane fatty-acyl-phospholipid synthase-like methyltransferase